MGRILYWVGYGRDLDYSGTFLLGGEGFEKEVATLFTRFGLGYMAISLFLRMDFLVLRTVLFRIESVIVILYTFIYTYCPSVALIECLFRHVLY